MWNKQYIFDYKYRIFKFGFVIMYFDLQLYVFNLFLIKLSFIQFDNLIYKLVYEL